MFFSPIDTRVVGWNYFELQFSAILVDGTNYLGYIEVTLFNTLSIMRYFSFGLRNWGAYERVLGNILEESPVVIVQSENFTGTTEHVSLSTSRYVLLLSNVLAKKGRLCQFSLLKKNMYILISSITLLTTPRWLSGPTNLPSRSACIDSHRHENSSAPDDPSVLTAQRKLLPHHSFQSLTVVWAPYGSRDTCYVQLTHLLEMSLNKIERYFVLGML